MTAALRTGPSATSAATIAAQALVAEHLPRAIGLGADVAQQVHDPEAFALALRSGLADLADLADPAYLDGQRRVAPGIGMIHGVRRPLLDAVARSLRAATADDRATTLLFVADRLLREPHLEAHWLAFGILERTIAGEPERSWQLMRRAARNAADWITVDCLARPYAAGVAGEPYRWSELEQLVYSPSRWERRLVGSTVATLGHGRRRPAVGDIVASALPILEQLMGDAEPDVQKALAWAYRSLSALDRAAVTTALEGAADIAARTDDGHRAWVVREGSSKLDPADAAALHARIRGIRRRADAPSTSAAARTAAAFGRLPEPAAHPEPPL